VSAYREIKAVCAVLQEGQPGFCADKNGGGGGEDADSD
jgi:hypothetical protein